MKMTKKTSSFFAFLLLLTTFNSYSMEKKPREWTEMSAWEQIVGGVLLGTTAIKMLWQSNDSFAFTQQLPKDIQKEIIKLLSLGITATSLREATFTINSLAQVNHELNELINDRDFCLKLIKRLAIKFNCSDQEAAEALQTKAAKKQLELQNLLYRLCTEHKRTIDLTIEELYDLGADLEFTYHSYPSLYKNEKSLTPLMCSLFSIDQGAELIKMGVNINKANENGTTALMLAAKYGSLGGILDLIENESLNINQQDLQGNTALMICCQKASDISNNTYVDFLLETGADPELANFAGLTPLAAAQQTGDQELINLIQDAINKKG